MWSMLLRAEARTDAVHAPVGGLPYTGEMQDFRMYVGTALTAEEVKGYTYLPSSLSTKTYHPTSLPTYTYPPISLPA
eukprot:1318109-Rhodomonas_salina.1